MVSNERKMTEMLIEMGDVFYQAFSNLKGFAQFLADANRLTFEKRDHPEAEGVLFTLWEWGFEFLPRLIECKSNKEAMVITRDEIFDITDRIGFSDFRKHVFFLTWAFNDENKENKWCDDVWENISIKLQALKRIGEISKKYDSVELEELELRRRIGI